MAVFFTTEERQAVMSLFRQFAYPNYDDNCRAEEAWLKRPENQASLNSFKTKFLSPDALTSAPPQGVGPAPAAVMTAVKAATAGVSPADSPQSTVVKLNDGAPAPVPGNTALTPSGGAAAAPDANAAKTEPKPNPESVKSETDPKGDAEPRPEPKPEPVKQHSGKRK